MMSRRIVVEIVADTRPLQRALKRAELLVARSWWRRLFLRIALWRLQRTEAQ